MLIGAHVSTSGGLPKAVERGIETGFTAIQIFNQSPRMWRPTKFTDDDFAAFRDAMADSPVDAVVIHAIYLINPGTFDPEISEKGLGALTHALQVGDAIGASGVVVHPGALKDDTRTNARKRAVKLIKEALAETERCPILYENTAGSPQLLGRDFDETAELIEKTGGPKRLGLCIDSCHLHATGYDVRTPRGNEGPRRRDRREDRPETAQAPPRERLARCARLQPRPPRPDSKWGDRPKRDARLPRRAAPSGASRRARGPRRGWEGTRSEGHPDHQAAASRGNPKGALMLLNRRALDGIAAGEIDLAFRRWKRPTVRAGGTLRTRAGVLSIDSVEPTSQRRISVEDARRAGFASRAELLRSLRPEGRLYRIEFHRIGDDPRAALRERSEITDRERAELDARLDRMDLSRGEPWTRRLLELIAERPETLGADLAASLGRERLPSSATCRTAQGARPDRGACRSATGLPRGRADLAGATASSSRGSRARTGSRRSRGRSA